jgi:hypothetical protein
MDLTGLFGAAEADHSEKDRRGAIRRELLAKLRDAHNRDEPGSARARAKRRALVARVANYDREHLSPAHSKTTSEGSYTLASSEFEAIVDEGLVETTGEGLVQITPRGCVVFGCDYWSSHLQHALQSALEATVMWATTLDCFTGARWSSPVVGHGLNGAAEYAAFTHQRALFEVLTRAGKASTPDEEPTDAQRARQVLGIAEDEVPLVADVLGPGVVSELNRACSHSAAGIRPQLRFPDRTCTIGWAG